MKEGYTGGFDYGFFPIEFGMRKLGMWPSGTSGLLIFDVRWCLVTTINLIIAMSLVMEIYMSCGDTSNTLDSCLVLNASIHGICNCVFPKIHRKKLAENVNAAIEDWSYSSRTDDERDRAIMTRYARTGRLLGIGQLTLGLVGSSLYFGSVLLIETNRKSTNGTVHRKYVIPVECLFATVSYTEYNAILILQMFEALTLLVTQCAVDSFFLANALHLCGQLDILKIRLSNFIGASTSSAIHHRFNDPRSNDPRSNDPRSNDPRSNDPRSNDFRSFVARHCRLIDLAGNLEDAFHLSIMIQLLMNALLTALTGFKFILSIKSGNNLELTKSLLFMKFTIVQSFFYTCAGDLLENHSGDIFNALCQTSWDDLPLSTIKSLAFVMARSKKPLRISAGKFLYISRITFIDILKAAASYISFLQITI